MIDVCSNLSDDGLTPEGLRNLVKPRPKRAGSAEVEPFRRQRLSQRLSTEVIADLVARYEHGESATTLAGQLGIAPSALLRLLRKQGVAIRGQRVTPELSVRLQRDYEAGATTAELSEQHKLSRGAVLRVLHSAGVEMRGKWPRPHA